MVVGEFTQETDLLVIGGGPGGYTAAFRAAQLGVQTAIVDARASLGGVCLHEGCIPSKTLLNVADTLHVAEAARQFEVDFKPPRIDLERMRAFKAGVVEKLAGGLEGRARRHGVERLTGRARFEDSRHVVIQGGPVPRVRFRRALVATGSRPSRLPGSDAGGERVLDSSGALALREVPRTALVVGGGYIGLELGQVWAALGAAVTLVEMEATILPGADADLVRPLARRLAEDFETIALKTRVTALRETRKGVEVRFAGEGAPARTRFDAVLVAVGREPVSDTLDLEQAGVEVDDRGFILVDNQFRTKNPRVFGIGDVIGGPMLAHKAMCEGKIVAEGVLAIEMGAADADLTEIIHPHPTLSELTGEVADLMALARRAARVT